MDPSRLADLKARAKAGDRAALQELRDAGFFAKKAGEKGWPLSHAQKRLWIIDRMMEGGSDAYNIPVALRLEGDLDIAALGRALTALVARHESLRTAFREIDGEARQFVESPMPIALPVVDLAGELDPEAAARAVATRDAAEVFDLAHAPLLRARLLRLAAARHVLLLNIHHIVFDERSTEVFVRDLAAFYRAFRLGEEPRLEPLPIQYKDYAAWQAKRLASPETESLRRYWLKKLGGRIEPLELPLDRPRPAIQDFAGDLVERALDAPPFGRLEELARRRGMSAFMAIAAVLKVLLHRVTGQEDIVIGMTTAGRERRELAGQIGFFVNALALRDALDPSLSFSAVLDRIKATALEAYENQSYPFDRLVDELDLERDLSRSPIFDLMLIVSDEATPALALEGLAISLFDLGRVSAKFDLTFDFVRGERGWTLRVIYATRLFDRDRIERLVDLFERIVALASAAPDRAIGELELVTPEEKNALLALAAGPPRDYPLDRSIVDLFDEQVARTPEAIAVHAPGGAALTYAGLKAHSEEVAGALLARVAIEPGDCVALIAGRGVGLVAAILGIMRAGGAYLPIDPSLPDERVELLLRDSGARAVISDHGNLSRGKARSQECDRHRPRHGWREMRWCLAPTESTSNGAMPIVIVLDEIGESSAKALNRRPSAADLAYIIYTSGSTGAPKGVEVLHRGFVNMILAQIESFGVTRDDAVIQFASASFDASLSEIFMALLAGARLVTPDEETLKNPTDLMRTIRAERITVATLPPPYIRVLGWDELKVLRCLITAGEEAAPDNGALVAGGTQYWNAYGPTEFSVCATMGRVDPGGDAPARVPIGLPIANCQVHILEPGGTALRPRGLAGEICLAGPGLARGYRGRPELTAERFVEVDLILRNSPVGADLGSNVRRLRFATAREAAGPPYAGLEGRRPRRPLGAYPPVIGLEPASMERPVATSTRLYRTGDLGRFRADGSIEFLGRIDHQVKVRGYRVEPGEIESAIRRVPGVVEAAVVARGAELAAFVVASGSPPPNATGIRAALARQLPPYMVPERIIILDDLPRTPSGKIDRKALPATAATESPIGSTSRPPATDAERRLLAIWNEILGEARTGVEERFLELGGNSLKAILLVSRVQKELGARLAIREIFEEGTVAALAARLRIAGTAPALDPIPPAPPAPDYALSHAQRRLWTIERMGEGVGAYHIPGAMTIDGALDPERLRLALERLTARHESLRTVFIERDGEPRQRILDRARIDFEVVAIAADPVGAGLSPAPTANFIESIDRLGDSSKAIHNAIRTAIEDDVPRPFDLLDGPLLRTRLFRTPDSTWILYLNMHHLVSDGWSVEVLFRDLLGLYESVDAPLPALSVHYKDFAVWQNERLEGRPAAASREYWSRLLDGEIPVLEIPSDRSRPAVRSFRGASVMRRLDPSLSKRFRDEARRRNATSTAFWLALLYQALHRYSGAPEIIIGAPATFREHPDLEDQVGFFVNMLPLRMRIDPDESAAAFLGRTSALLQETFAHKDYPYDRLVEELAIRRDMGRNPLFDVVLSVAERGRSAPSASGLAVAPFPFASRTAKFDLTLFAAEGTDGAWELTIEYDTALFDEERVERLGEHIEMLLESFLAAPESPVVSLEMMTGAERLLVRDVFTGVATDYPRDRTVASVFEEIAAAHPDREAVATESVSLTYVELNARANHLARVLREEHGLRPEEPVGLLCRRSERTAVALLGILKAGGAYLPLEPSAPVSRLRFIIEDAASRIVIADREFRDSVLVGLAGVTPIALESIDREEHENPPSVGDGSSLAYIMYTSGSTGEPKGSLIEQRSILRLVRNTNYIEFGPGHRILQTGSLAFDASTFEFWGALLNGGTVCLPPEGALLEVTEFGALVARFRATTAWLTASLFNQMVEADLDLFRGLTHLLTGGERLSAPHANRVRAAFPRLVLINGYGPTENTTFTTCHQIEEPCDAEIPIGRPIANTRVFILDRNLQLVPVGIPGEICAAGDGLSRGYLNRPELTAEKFVEVERAGADLRPASTEPKTTDSNGCNSHCDGTPVFRPASWNRCDAPLQRRSEDRRSVRITVAPDSNVGAGLGPAPAESASIRLYRTGDIGWWNPDGTISIAGRLDDQVKIRGFRVEIGEVEAALRRIDGIADAAVVSRRTAIGTIELIGYLASDPGLDPDALRETLKRDLPAYMIPSRLVRLDRLPLTPNGKVDRRALPSPDESRSAARAVEAARGPAEEALLEAWRDLLGRAAIGRDENYFDLGGDSIRAIQIVSRMRRAGWQLKVRDLFRHPTIAELAACMTPIESPLLEEDVAGGPAPLSPIQKWFFRTQGGILSRFNQSVMLAASRPIDEAALRRALALLLERHAILRAVYRETPDGIVQEIGTAAEASLEIVDLSVGDDSDAALMAHADRLQGSLDPLHGSLMRTLLARRSDGDRLLLVVHHLAIDGVSWRILLEDLEAAYRGADLLPPTASFAAWTRRLESMARAGSFAAESDHWRALLETSPLPFDLEDAPPGTFGEAGTIELEFAPEVTRGLIEAGQRAYGAGPEVLLLAAFARAFRVVFGRSGILLALESHGRAMERVGLDVARTIGWFTSLHPFRLAPSGDSVADAVKSVKEDLRRVPDEGIGFGALGLELPPAISFNYLGRFGGEGRGEAAFSFAGEARGREIDPATRRSHHFDLSGLVAGDRLGLAVAFSPRRFRHETIERLAAHWRREIETVVAHCAARIAPERTPTDFSTRATSAWSLDDYDRFLEREGVAATEVEDLLPLSPMQEGLYFQRRLDPTSMAYQLQMAMRLKGHLDVEAYRDAWNDLVARHPVMRTSFHDGPNEHPVQLVRRARPPDFLFEDCSSLDRAAVDERLAALRKADLGRRFDLARDPLLRIAVVKTGPDEFETLWSYHHILIDGWSLGLLYRELLECYAARAVGHPPVAAPPRPFAAFLRWLEERDLAAGRDYWRARLAGLEETTRLAPPVEGGEYDYRETIVEAEAGLTESVGRLAARLGVTPYSVIQAAWTVVLARWTGARDIVFGSVVSGRPPNLAGVEETVGLFINAIPVRARIDDETPFADLARAIQADALAAEEHHHLPLAEIQRLAPSPAGFFDHILVFENYPVDREVADGSRTGASGLVVESFTAHDESHYPLNLVIVPGARLQLRFSHDGRLHDPASVARLAARLLEALARGVAEPDSPAGRLEVLPAEERAAIDTALQGPRRVAAAPGSVIDLFAAAVARDPEAVAVCMGEATLTYRRLDEESSRFAERLRARLDPRPDDRIGILLERSLRLPIALLGVMKAGAAYVPIDPDLPEERIEYLLSDSGARVLIIDQSSRRRGKACLAPTESTFDVGVHGAAGRSWSCDVLTMDEIIADAAMPLRSSPRPAPDSLAYVIYTSGSTGRPKGCAIEHRQLAHYLEWAGRAYFDDPRAGSFGLFTSLSFDLTVTTLYLPLVRGRALVIAPSEVETHEALRAMLESASGVDSLKITPSHIAMIPDLGLDRTAVSLAVVGGEALRPEQVAILHRLNPRMAVWNEYGPTETTVGCIVKRVEPGAAEVTIGRPIDETTLLLLDARQRPVPYGAQGEIWIGGAGVGRGYLGRPELTEERFVEIGGERVGAQRAVPLRERHNMRSYSAARFYRTGDLGRLRPDGELEYLGRADDQVKIRGHRIEPGEIEAAIGALSFVKDGVVLARKDATGESRLVAYVVPADQPHDGDSRGGGSETRHAVTADAAVYTAALARLLPDHMIPSVFVELDRLPLTPNGKVDRKALPDPWLEAAVAPEGEITRPGLESDIAAIWREVLGVERIGRTESFFALGGHSLKATQVVSRILRRLKVRVSLADFIREPTITALARLAEAAGAQGADDRIPRAAVAPDYALSHAQHRLWLLHHIEGGETAYNMPFAFRLRGGDLDAALLEKAFAALIARHEALRTAFVIRDGEPRQKILSDCAFRIATSFIAESSDVEAGIRRIAETEARAPFDLAKPPLLRLTVVRSAEELFIFLVMHHIVGDGWSGLLLARELMEFYASAAAQRPPTLAPLPIHYKDFSEWQNARGFEKEEHYWLAALSGAPERIALPFDFPPGRDTGFRGDVVRARLDAGTTDRLRALAAAKRTTLSNVTLALFGLLLNKISAQEDLVIGMSIANRNHPDLERLIGFFVNMLPIRLRFKEEMEFDGLLAEVAARTAEAAGHQDYPFDLLVEKINPERVSNRQPLLNVVYAFQNFSGLSIDPAAERFDASPHQRPERTEEQLEPIDFTFGTSKFDLTLFLAEEADGLALVLEYDTALFKKESAERMMASFAHFSSMV